MEEEIKIKEHISHWFCWCDPVLVYQIDGSEIWVHNIIYTA